MIKNDMKEKLCNLLVLIVFAMGCGSNEGKSDNKDMQCIAVDNSHIFIPKSWEVINQDKTFFFAAPEKNNYKYIFFTIGKYNLNSTGLNLSSYLKFIYKELSKKDSIENFSGYNLKRINFKDRSNYYMEYFSKVDNQEYLAYSMIFQVGDYLYDFILKVRREDGEEFKNIFNDIIFNFKLDKSLVFHRGDEILSTEIIDISRL